MRLKLDKKRFTKHINNVSRGIISYSPLFALKGILLDANESRLVMVASDGFLSFREEIANNEGLVINEPGKILIPGKIFKDVIEKTGDNIEINTDDSKMVVKSDLTNTEINLYNVADYPRIAFESFGKELTVDAAKFKSMIRNVAFAAAADDKRQILNGVNIKASNGNLVISATNSFRLARETTTIDSAVDFDVTIMAKKIRDFLPANATGAIKINFDDSKITSQIGTTTISSRIIDGVYPPVEKLIASEFTSNIVVDTSEFEKNVDRVTLVAEGTRSVVRLECDATKLLLESKRSEIGVASSRVEQFVFQGEPINIAFDNSFLREALSKFEGKVAIAFNGAHKPFVIKGVSNKNLVQLIMPHRTF